MAVVVVDDDTSSSLQEHHPAVVSEAGPRSQGVPGRRLGQAVRCRKRRRKSAQAVSTRATCVCWAMTSATRIAQGSLLSRNRRERARCPNQSSRARRNRTRPARLVRAPRALPAVQAKQGPLGDTSWPRSWPAVGPGRDGLGRFPGPFSDTPHRPGRGADRGCLRHRPAWDTTAGWCSCSELLFCHRRRPRRPCAAGACGARSHSLAWGLHRARAVAAIAFGRPAAACDTNVRRVVTRLLGRPNTTARCPGLRRTASSTRVDPASWTHALMDLGASVCRVPRATLRGVPAHRRGAPRIHGGGRRFRQSAALCLGAPRRRARPSTDVAMAPGARRHPAARSSSGSPWAHLPRLDRQARCRGHRGGSGRALQSCSSAARRWGHALYHRLDHDDRRRNLRNRSIANSNHLVLPSPMRASSPPGWTSTGSPLTGRPPPWSDLGRGDARHRSSGTAPRRHRR